MAQLRATQDPRSLQQFSKLAANLLVVCAIISAVLFSFIFFSNVTAAYSQLHEESLIQVGAAGLQIQLQEETTAIPVQELTPEIQAPDEATEIQAQEEVVIAPTSQPKQTILSTIKKFAEGIINPAGIAGGIKLNFPIIFNSKSSVPVTGSVSPEAAPSTDATPEAWNGSSRVTVLVMGLDYRDWETGNVPRSDSMWVFTVDPKTKTAGMMSIPRDTWVYVPGFDYAKINMAYFYGEAYHTEGGGPALAMQTVSQFLDVPIQYYVQVDFNAFVQFIDKLDGITIDVPEGIQVDPIGQGNTVTLQPGKQRLFGAVALGYARNRYTAGGDFDRAKRQLQVINGIRERVMDPSYLPVLIKNAKGVYELVQSGVKTNLQLDEAVRLAWLAQQVPQENIRHATLGREQMYDSWSPQGWSIEVPLMDQVIAVRDSVFSTAPGQVSQAPAEPTQKNPGSVPAEALQENASIYILNGTSSAGLAGRTADYLKSFGLNVVQVADAQGFYEKTSVVDYQGRPSTAQSLAQLLGIGQDRILNGGGENIGADIVVTLGEDWATNNPLAQE